MHRRHTFLLFIFPLLLTACFGEKTVKRDVVIGKEVLTTVMPTGPVQHPAHGAEEWFSVGAVSGVDKEKANGVSQLHVFEDNASIVDVRLNIEKAAAGKRYVVALKDSVTNEMEPIGDLSSILGDARHAINVTITKDLRTYQDVLVFRETSKQPAYKNLVAKGLLKEQKRGQ